MRRGKFQGDINPHTPIDSLLVWPKRFPVAVAVRPLILSVSPAKNLKWVAQVLISQVAQPQGFPLSRTYKKD
jgi:hypothetical protein